MAVKRMYQYKQCQKNQRLHMRDPIQISFLVQSGVIGLDGLPKSMAELACYIKRSLSHVMNSSPDFYGIRGYGKQPTLVHDPGS